MVHMILSKEFEFEASHKLPNYDGNCANLHGHSYKLIVHIKGMPDPDTGMVMDFKELKYMANKYVVDRFDHTYINDIMDVPTAENMIVFMWNELILHMPQLYKLELWETRTSKVEYRGMSKEELIGTDSITESTGSKK